MVMNCIHENDGIDRFQWSFLPFLYDRQNFIRNAANGAVRNIDIVKVFHMTFDISGSHSFGIHGDDFFLHILCNGILILFHQFRLKFSVPVSGNADIHITVTGMHGLLGMVITAIVCSFITIVIL